MALRATPTLAICLTAGLAAGIALARPDDLLSPQAVPIAPVTAPPVEIETVDATDSPYLVDGESTASAPAIEVVTPAAPVAAEITIDGFQFGGATSAAPGSPLSVINLDGPAHTLTAADGSFDSGTLNQNESASLVVPSAPGTYEFFCAIHPSMVGTLTVG